jgi:hypothetical protein
VGSLPSGYISRAAFPVAVELCRHIDRGQMLEGLIAEFRPEWFTADGGVERLAKLLQMADAESKAVVSCCRALRLTPQAVMHPRTAGRRLDDGPSGPKPWEWFDELGRRRMREYRRREREGRGCLTIEADLQALSAALIDGGFLDERHCDDRDKIAEATERALAVLINLSQSDA